MKIDQWRMLRSLRNEAERQADFYGRRGDQEAAKAWADVGDCASEAIEIKGELVLTVLHKVVPQHTIQRVVLKDPPIIKAGEQGQQVSKAINHNTLHKGGL